MRQPGHRQPLDSLVWKLVTAQHKAVYVRTPCLFQMIGTISSLPGKLQTLSAPRFRDLQLRRWRRSVRDIPALLRERPTTIVRFMAVRGRQAVARIVGPVWRALRHRPQQS